MSKQIDELKKQKNIVSKTFIQFFVRYFFLKPLQYWFTAKNVGPIIPQTPPSKMDPKNNNGKSFNFSLFVPAPNFKVEVVNFKTSSLNNVFKNANVMLATEHDTKIFQIIVNFQKVVVFDIS